MLSTITKIRALEILDSRSCPTIEAEITLADGSIGRASVPSGASCGIHEAFELRDQKQDRYHGKGVLNTVQQIYDIIAPALVGQDVLNQEELDANLIALDGTENKRNLGANAILAISMAAARAGAAFCELPLYRYLGGTGARVLPVPMINILNGGLHADNQVDIQEFMIVPVGFPCFSNALQAGSEVFLALKEILKKRQLPTGLGDEGGFAPPLESNEQGLTLLTEAVESAGYEPGSEICFALDIAASEFYSAKTDSNHEHTTGSYHFENQDLSAVELVEKLARWVDQFPVVSIEDGCAQDDWDGWNLLTETLTDRVQLVGDDLFATNPQRIELAAEKGIANAVLVKLNQIGTVSETLWAMETARRNGYELVVSHRSGETDDSFIADLAVGTNCGQIKTGSVARGERIAKYNELLRIENNLGSAAVYAGTFWE